MSLTNLHISNDMYLITNALMKKDECYKITFKNGESQTVHVRGLSKDSKGNVEYSCNQVFQKNTKQSQHWYYRNYCGKWTHLQLSDATIKKLTDKQSELFIKKLSKLPNCQGRK